MPARRLTTTVSGGADAASAARRALAPLRSLLESTLADDVALLVSELVTNSVRHAGARSGEPIGLEVSAWPRRVRVEVSDPGGGFAVHEPRPQPDGTSGWGLYLVDRLADRWGAADGTVWFEMTRCG